MQEKLFLIELPIEERKVIEEIKKQMPFPLIGSRNFRGSGYCISKNHVSLLQLVGKPYIPFTIPENIENLSELDTLIIDDLKNTNFPKGIEELYNLHKFSFLESRIHFADLKFLKNLPLEEITLDCCLPRWIVEIPTLNKYSQFNFDSIPKSIAKLEKLEELTFSNNRLKKIPRWLTNLPKLSVLRFHETEISKIPHWFEDFSSLEVLDLSDNNLNESVKNLRKIPTLKELNLGGTNLKDLPEFLKNLSNLNHLNLIRNTISKIPEWFGDFAPLESLMLISEVPLKDIKLLTRLTTLKKLQIHYNNHTLPADFSNLSRLESLELQFTNLSAKDPLFDLVGLKELDLSFSDLKNIPNDIERLVNLRKLDLSWNKLKSLSSGFSSLIKLESLDLGTNQFKTLPNSFRNLQNLRTLNLFQNSLNEFPSIICNIESLEFLHLSENPIRSLPICIKNLTNLQEFSFNSEHFESIPDFFKEMHSLVFLGSNYYYKYFSKTLIEYAQQYCKDPKSLTQDEKDYLIYKSSALERNLLEANLPPTDPVLTQITKRMTTISNSGLEILR